MTTFLLKIIAMITMTCDHAGDALFNNNMLMRSIGRIAFLIYAFLMAEGFRHIRGNNEKVKDHLIKLIFLAAVSEFCYDFEECGFRFAEYFESQNNIITLLLSFLGMMGFEYFKGNKKAIISIVFTTAFMNYACLSNYKMVGVLIVYAFYIYLDYAEEHKFNYFQKLVTLLAIILVYIPVYQFARMNFTLGPKYFAALFKYGSWWFAHIFTMFILAGYNGQLGNKNKLVNQIYSIYYPAHLFVIGVLKLIFIH